MAQKRSSRLNRMRANPAGDWTMDDIAAVCRELKIRCAPPSGGGSHWKVSHTSQRAILTIPSGRRVKPVYIRNLVRFIDGVLDVRE